MGLAWLCWAQRKALHPGMGTLYLLLHSGRNHQFDLWHPCMCVAAVDDSIYMLPEVQLPSMLEGLPKGYSEVEPELKRMIRDVILEAGGCRPCCCPGCQL